MIRPIKSYTRISTRFAEQPDPGRFGRHLGIDYAAPVGTPVYAPAAGVVTQVVTGTVGGKTIEVRAAGRLRRFLHLSRQDVRVGQAVKEGQQLGLSGRSGQVSGPHLHYDVRADGTAWSGSFGNYVDPEAELAEANKPVPNTGKFAMPPIGTRVKLDKGITRTTFDKFGRKVGSIYTTDDTWVYRVRGINGNRIVINSASGGGDGVELALYYLSGGRIAGWKQV